MVANLCVRWARAYSYLVAYPVASCALDEWSWRDGGLGRDAGVVHEGLLSEEFESHRACGVIHQDMSGPRRRVGVG